MTNIKNLLLFDFFLKPCFELTHPMDLFIFRNVLQNQLFYIGFYLRQIISTTFNYRNHSMTVSSQIFVLLMYVFHYISKQYQRVDLFIYLYKYYPLFNPSLKLIEKPFLFILYHFQFLLQHLILIYCLIYLFFCVFLIFLLLIILMYLL